MRSLHSYGFAALWLTMSVLFVSAPIPQAWQERSVDLLGTAVFSLLFGVELRLIVDRKRPS